MKTTTFGALPTYHVIVAGPMADAVKAAGHYTHKPLFGVSINGYGSVHAQVKIEPAAIDRWSHAGEPGKLLWFDSDPGNDDAHTMARRVVTVPSQ